MRTFLTISFLFSFTCSFCQTKLQLDSITTVLAKVSIDDQKYRLGWDSTMQKYGINSPEFISLLKQMNHQDSIDMISVAAILDTFGWLSAAQTSDDANNTLFMVIQHATLPSQLKYLLMMKKAVADKKAKGSDYALLIDRTNMNLGKLQIYGSQLNYDSKGHLHIYPVFDEPNLNKRRKAIGLPPMQQYLQLFSEKLTYTLPATDRYKNKIIIKGNVTDKKENQPLPDVSIYTTNGHLARASDSSGFFQVLIDKRNRNHDVILKKQGFETFTFKPDDDTKQVFEIYPVLNEK